VVVIPSDLSEESLITLLLSLPMGWNHSPQFFCTYTEKVANLANDTATPTMPYPLLLTTKTQHPTPPVSFAESATLLGHLDTPPLAYTNIYLDDFIIIAQPPTHLPMMNKLHHALHAKAICLSKKASQGDATFFTQKRILGWDIDTTTMTLTLPCHSLDSLQSMLTLILACKHVSRCKWRRLLGLLCSTMPALYSAIHYFSILQHVLTDTTAGRIRLTPLLKAVLTG